MKRIFLTLMTFLTPLFLCTACGSNSTAPLRICIESPWPSDYFPAESYAYNFVSNAKDYGAIESVDDLEI